MLSLCEFFLNKKNSIVLLNHFIIHLYTFSFRLNIVYAIIFEKKKATTQNWSVFLIGKRKARLKWECGVRVGDNKKKKQIEAYVFLSLGISEFQELIEMTIFCCRWQIVNNNFPPYIFETLPRCNVA